MVYQAKHTPAKIIFTKAIHNGHKFNNTKFKYPKFAIYALFTPLKYDKTIQFNVSNAITHLVLVFCLEHETS